MFVCVELGIYTCLIDSGHTYRLAVVYFVVINVLSYVLKEPDPLSVFPLNIIVFSNKKV